MPRSKTRPNRTACHRPALKKPAYRHDKLTAVDLFSGFGGLTEALRRAGFTTIAAANHNEYKVRVHEANHEYAEHFIADLVNRDASDYHSAADLPAADLLAAGISCTNHSQANTQKAYEQGMTLFDLPYDEEYEERVTRSERDRATATCILQYADKHRPRMILIECTTEFTSWGPAIQGSKKIGDGATYRWWRQQLRNMKYRARVLYLNSQFFGVSQSRDRIFIVFWQEDMPEPDLDHRPESFCGRCDQVVPAVWTWKTGIPPTGVVRYGQQYKYCCPRCHGEVVPPMAPSINSLDLTNLGTRVGDKPLKTFKDGFVGPMARNTMGRAERCFNRFSDFPPVMLPTSALPAGHPWEIADAQTVTSTGAAMVAAGNTFERPGSDCRSRDLSEPLWTQHATNAVGLVTPPIAMAGHVFAAHRHNGDGQHFTRPMDTNTATYEKALLFAAVDNFQGAPRGLVEPTATQGGSETMALVSAGIIPFRQNTLPTVHDQPMPTVTAEQNPGLLSAQGQLLGALTPSHAQLAEWWRDALASITLDDCYFRMLFKHEVGRSCGFDVDFPGYQGTFKVWGTAQQQIDGFGNAVSPAVGEWICSRLRPVLAGDPHRRQLSML